MIIAQNEKSLNEIISTKPQMGLSTGINDLDAAILGLRPAHLIMVGGFSGVGKSSYMADLTIAAAKQVPVAVFSLEMGIDLFVQRLVYNYADLNYHSGMAGHLTENEKKKLQKAMKDVESLHDIYVDCQSDCMYPTWILEKGEPPKNSLELAIKKYHSLGCRLFLIDYIQYVMFGFKSETETLRLKHLTGHLHKMAVELDVPIVTFAQLKKEVGDKARQSDNHRPTLTDLRDSGFLICDSDVILMLHRPAYFDKTNDISLYQNIIEDDAEIVVVKQRNGPTGVIPVSFHAYSMRWVNRDRDRTNIITGSLI